MACFLRGLPAEGLGRMCAKTLPVPWTSPPQSGTRQGRFDFPQSIVLIGSDLKTGQSRSAIKLGPRWAFRIGGIASGSYAVCDVGEAAAVESVTSDGPCLGHNALGFVSRRVEFV